MASSSRSSPSSSSSKPAGRWTHDVFLSFRGEDTRYTFVDHLYAALVQSGLIVFKDEEMLQGGKEISPELLEAVKGSRCAVVVLSKNYANSTWCLAELAEIMECRNRMGQLVIPVFYHVDPSHVRTHKRDFRTAFRKHKSEFKEEMDKVKRWKEALTAVSKLSGYHISETVKEGESAFINKIVGDTLGNIRPGGMEKNLIDIESRINELNLLLVTEATEVRMVGIWGMGGIGKTTIARALFGRISCKFDGSSFVKGVRENSKRDICVLQQKILKDMTHHKYKITDPEDGAEMIQSIFCKKKVLLVLDDVDDAKQLKFLAATHKWFCDGSRIIITTRDQHLLSDTNGIYKPGFLLKEHAVKLFSRHAFRKNSPPEEYKELSNRVVRYTGGLPLALEVLGSFFRKREAQVWDSALKRLAKTPDRVIFETLKISFDGLEASEKKIFLDIACFFKGYDEELVTKVLDSFGFDPAIGISALIEKSLLTNSNKRIHMHDVLQEMGLEIVRKSYPYSRLWQCEEIHDFISKNRNLEVVEAIVLLSNENMGFNADVFENMKNIRLLHIFRDFTSGEPTTLPDELRWLTWDEYPFSSLPVANLRKLVAINMKGGEIEHLWMGYKFMPNLKFIHLEDLSCIESFPDVSGAPNVERLILFRCWNLVEVHKSLGTLRKLAYLKMSGCWKLKCLPYLIEMQLLETLDLSNCMSLEKFPEVSSGMEKLSNIYLNGCSCLKIIPSSICELKNLKILQLQDCMALQHLPEELGRMEKIDELWLGVSGPMVSSVLKSLHLHNCKKLPEELGSTENLEEIWLGFGDSTTFFQWQQPDSINFQTLTKLCCLRKLDLSWRQIEEQDFLNNLDAFSSLEELHLSGNSKLVQLPACISRLSHLKHLELNDCQQLQNIQGLPSGIQLLRARDCTALEIIEDLTKEYVWLHKIFLPGCERLLQNQENETYLDNMLQQSFLKKCAAGDHVLSICIPGSKIPSWFQEQRHGYQIALKLPHKCHANITGFAVCGVFQGKWPRTVGTTEIHFKVGISVTLIPESKVDYNKAYSATENESSIWIVYIPFSFFQEQQMYDDYKPEDWSLSVEGNLIITILESEFINKKIVRCGAHIMYKEDVELLQQINMCIPDKQNSNIGCSFDDSFIYREKYI